MKKIVIFCILCLINNSFAANFTLAEEISIVYDIFDENENLLAQRADVEVGDKIIDKLFNEYEVYLKDEIKAIAKARFVQTYRKPNITKKIEKISSKKIEKKIALYMTHNDESFIIGDGTESVYGAGGIHDIAHTIKNNLTSLGVEVELDETLHIPHNSSAYSRSAQTAKKLIANQPDAIFDIHRDGANRKYYVTTYDGKERSKIRIVLGQSYPNSAENLKFALYLLSVAEVECPWLFQDIYWGKGHYNQALSNKALLFEMGTHTIEKDYVEEAAKELARIIDITLYGTTVNEDDELTIGQEEDNMDVDIEKDAPTVNEKLDMLTSNRNNGKAVLIISLIASLLITGGIVFYAFQTNKKKRKG